MKNLIIFAFLMVTNRNGYSQEFSNPKLLFDPQPYAFSHIATVPANHKLVFIAGQGGEENSAGELSLDFRRQTYRALRNIEIALHSQGLEMSAVVKVTTLVVDHDAEKLQILVEEFQKLWPDKKYPINTLIPVPKLALENMLVEIDAIAIAK